MPFFALFFDFYDLLVYNLFIRLWRDHRRKIGHHGEFVFMSVTVRPFGFFEGNQINEYTLSRGNITAKILDLGGIVRCFSVKAFGKETDVALGYDDIDGYIKDTGSYFGALVGRVSNRISDAGFTLNGKEYRLNANHFKNCLHGGKRGYDRRIWTAEIAGDYALKLSLTSPDGEEGFPGELKITAVYSVTSRGGLKVEFSAETDADTPVSLTNHSAFNLNGAGSGTILGHILKINAHRIIPIDETFTPLGGYIRTAGTPFDFINPKPIGKDIDSDDRIMRYCGGYDVDYVSDYDGFFKFAEVVGDKSGIRMRVFTTEKNLQFYSGNFLTGTPGKGGNYNKHDGFCLEGQKTPNAINCPEYPSCVLKKGEKYRSIIEYVLDENPTDNERPLDTVKTDGGFTGIFRTFGAIGDSLSSGELESLTEDGNRGYHDIYEYSWGQFIAEKSRMKCFNFSRGGLTARTFNEFEEQGKLLAGNPCQAYIIALGVNDRTAVVNGSEKYGDISTDVDFDDYRNNANTVIGNYFKIIQKIKEISPKSRIFLTTPPVDFWESEDKTLTEFRDKFADFVRSIPSYFPWIYVMDLRKYCPPFDEKMREKYYCGGHLNVLGYKYVADVFSSYMDYIIRKNYEDFKQTGFIGTDLYYCEDKW